MQFVIGCLASSNHSTHFDCVEIRLLVLTGGHYVVDDFDQNQLFQNDFMSYKINGF